MDLELDNEALWKRRMRSPRIEPFDIAVFDKSKAIIETNISGKKRTYYWHIDDRLLENIEGIDCDYYCLITLTASTFIF